MNKKPLFNNIGISFELFLMHAVLVSTTADNLSNFSQIKYICFEPGNLINKNVSCFPVVLN